MLLNEIKFEPNGFPFQCLADFGTYLLKTQCVLLEDALEDGNCHYGEDDGKTVRVQREGWDRIIGITSTIQELVELLHATLDRLSEGPDEDPGSLEKDLEQSERLSDHAPGRRSGACACQGKGVEINGQG